MNVWLGRPSIVAEPRRRAVELALDVLSAGILAVAAATAPPAWHVALLVAGGVALLEWAPVLLVPAGRLLLVPLITLPTTLLFGWQPAVLGTTLGILLSALPVPDRPYRARIRVEVPALALAGVGATLAGHAWSPVPAATPTVATCLAYFAALMVLETVQMCVDEGVDWGRAARYVGGVWGVHAGMESAIVLVSVVATAEIRWPLGAYVVPPLAALVALQIYYPHIRRGLEQQRMLASVALMASAVDAKDPYTGDHSQDVARLSLRVARILGLDEHEAHNVYLTGLMHDIGKVVVPPEILRKRGDLTDEERAVMQRHVDAGADMIRNITGLEDIASSVAATHEHVNGSGYPRHLTGENIPLSARINLVIDAYNALTTTRPYRVACSAEEAYVEIQAHAGKQFDVKVVEALGIAIGLRASRRDPARVPRSSALRLLRTRSFALLYAGELISYLGDEIFLIALSLWVYKLTGSAVMLAAALIAGVAGQGVFGLFAGAVADRFDRRRVIIVSDIARTVVIALLPLVLPRSIPFGFVLLLAASIGTIFFRSGLMALVPTIVPASELGTANALLQTTARIAEVAGGVLGAGLVILLGYQLVFYLNALSFLASALAVALIPLGWRAGLSTAPRRAVRAEIAEGLRFISETPLHRFLALLVFPGYLTLAAFALMAPMVVGTAHLSPMAYGTVYSAWGGGKLIAAVALAGGVTRWMTPSFVVAMYVVTSVGIAVFGSSSLFPLLVIGAAVYGFGNVATTVANMTLSMAATPTPLVGRVMASRQVFIAIPTILGMVVFGRLADIAGTQASLLTLAFISAIGVAGIWGRFDRTVLPQRVIPSATGAPAAAQITLPLSSGSATVDSATPDAVAAETR